MKVIGLKLPLIKSGEALAAHILKAARQAGGLRDGDVLVVASKVVAISQGRVVELSKVHPSSRVKKIAAKTGQPPEFVELVLREADEIVEVGRDVILAVKNGMICANAGIDTSNAPPGHVVLMPSRPEQAARKLRAELVKASGRKIAVIISDSHVGPLRLGTVGQALGIAGIEPVVDCRGKMDLYGKPLRITFRALADQLATAAQLVMGEGDERVPAALVRGAGVKLVSRPKRSPKISPRRCIYFGRSTA